MLLRYGGIQISQNGYTPMLRRCIICLTLVLCAVSPAQAHEPLTQPSGRVLLTISGAIAHTNVGETAKFDRDMLLKLGTHTLRTTTFWTDGVREFEGVLASDIMDAVGARGTLITATALNDYVVDIPIADFKKYGVLFALKMDGKVLTARDKGPIWPIYPRDDFPELRNRAADKKWIYHLYKMVIK